MGIFSKFFNKVETETISTNPTTEELNQFFNGNFEITSKTLNSATYYACMQIRCNAVAKLPFKVMRESENGVEKAVNHELYYLLKNRPNAYTTPHDFIWATEYQKLEYGNAFWVMDIQQGKRKGLYLLDSRRVTIMNDDKGILDKPNALYYLYEDPLKGLIVYTSDEIVHFKNFAMNGYRGSSIKKYLYETIANETYSNKMLQEKYKSGLQDPIIVQYAGDFSEAIQNKIKNKFNSLGGSKSAGKVVPIPTDFKVDQLETNLVSNQFFELQGLTTIQIANAFGVKNFQLNNTEKSTQITTEQQNKAFYSDTLQNVLTEYEQETTYKLLTYEEQSKDGYFVKILVDSILRSDLASRTNSYKEGINNGYMTIAEVRAREDLPYIEGTDKLIIGNGASIPLEDLGKQYDKNKSTVKGGE